MKYVIHYNNIWKQRMHLAYDNIIDVLKAAKRLLENGERVIITIKKDENE